MDDVAAAAGVSKGAVSKVIRNAYGVSPAMRERVEAAIGQLGYRPRIAARVMRGASFTLGFEIPQLGNEFFTQVMQGAADALAGSGYQLVIAPGLGEMRGAPVLDALVDRQVDGLIAISPEVSPEWLEQLGEDVPLVLLGRHDASKEYDTLTNDDAVGAGLIMDHLRELGHDRIAHITVGSGPDVPTELTAHAIRRRSYLSRIGQDGLVPRLVVAEASEAGGYLATMELLGSPDRPTAIFAGNDTLAIGALRARSELGLTPTEISIAGYDDIDISANPLISLTSVDQFGHESGRIAVEMLMERIRYGRTEPRHHQIAPELRIRDSTAQTSRNLRR